MIAKERKSPMHDVRDIWRTNKRNLRIGETYLAVIWMPSIEIGKGHASRFWSGNNNSIKFQIVVQL